jgi:hypothetical protein
MSALEPTEIKLTFEIQLQKIVKHENVDEANTN